MGLISNSIIGGIAGTGLGIGVGYANSRPGQERKGMLIGGLAGAVGGAGLGAGITGLHAGIKKASNWAAQDLKRTANIAANQSVNSATSAVAANTNRIPKGIKTGARKAFNAIGRGVSDARFSMSMMSALAKDAVYPRASRLFKNAGFPGIGKIFR